MNYINWNGGSIINNGNIKTIATLEIKTIQAGSSIFDRKELLVVATSDGEIIESLSRCC